MATSPSLTPILRDAEVAMFNAFNERSKDSVFEGIVDFTTDIKGYRRILTVNRLPTLKLLENELVPVGFDGKNLLMETQVWKSGVSIPRQVLENARGISGDGLDTILRGMGEDAADNLQQVWTELIDDNGSDVLGSAFFATSKALFNSESVTVTNTVGGSGTTAAQVRTDFFTAMKVFVDMENSGGRPFHGASVYNRSFIVMYNPSLEQVMRDVFSADKLTHSDGESNITKGAAELRPNALLADNDDWYLFIKNPTHPPLVGVQEKPVELESDARGGTANAGRQTILTDDYLFAARHVFITSYGSRMSVVRVTN